MLTRSKIRGMLVGGAIGDALGRPVECMSYEDIRKNHPDGVTTYVAPKNNKWFKDDKTGVITDDTQLGLAVVKALIRANGFGMGTQASYHVKAFKESTEGWGGSLRESIKKLSEGVRWSESGKTDKKGLGVGNGVLMRISPIGAWHAVKNKLPWPRFADKVVQFSAMTHYTAAAALSGVVHTGVIGNLLLQTPISYHRSQTFMAIHRGMDGRKYKRDSKHKLHYCVGHLNNPDNSWENLMVNLSLLHLFDSWTFNDVRKQFGNGKSYVVHSMPFAYYFFLKNPYTIGSLYNVVMAGGDTDTNAKLVGEMLGALHGLEFFETSENKQLLHGLKDVDELIQLADQFSDKFGIK